MNTPLPDWLQNPSIQQPPQPSLDRQSGGHVAVAIQSLALPSHQMTPEMRALERQTFEIAFEIALESMAEGVTLEDFCREYHTKLSPARFRNWMFRDANRSVAYRRAKMIGAEVVEDQLLRIADGKNPDGSASISDTNRDTLRINIRKWLLGVWNRKKYGDIKQVEQHTSPKFDPATATADQLQQELLRALGLDQAQGHAGTHGHGSHGHGSPMGMEVIEGEAISLADLIEESSDPDMP